METSSETGTESSPSTSSPPDSPAPTTHSQDDEPESKATTGRSGLEWPTPFARFVPSTSSSKTSPESEPRPAYAEMQESLLSEWSAPTWPRSAIGGRTTACELPTWAHLMDETDGSVWLDLLPTPTRTHNDGHDPEAFLERRARERAKGRNGNGFGLTLGMSVALLPTPAASESTPTDEFLDEVTEHLDPNDPLHRLYLPGRKWMTQRTLSRTVPALLPTAQARDGHGPQGNAYKGESDDLPSAAAKLAGDHDYSLLPTPRTNDGSGEFPLERDPNMDNLATRVKRSILPTPTARLGREGGGGPQAKRYPDPNRSSDLDDAIRFVEETEGGTKLLPTPTVNDSKNTASETQRGRHSEPLNLLAADAQRGKLLPTPVGTDALGTRNHTARRKNPDSKHADGTTLTDAIWMAEGRTEDLLGNPLANVEAEEAQPTLLPTPTASERGDRGQGSQARGGGRELRAVRKLLPTPETSNRKSRKAMTSSTDNGRRSGGGNSSPPGLEQIAELRAGRWPEDMPPYEELPPATREIVDSLTQLLPTPRVTSERNSRKSMTENQQWASVALAQALEIAQGVLPREFETWEEVPGSLGASMRQPSDGGNERSDGQLPIPPTNVGD